MMAGHLMAREIEAEPAREETLTFPQKCWTVTVEAPNGLRSTQLVSALLVDRYNGSPPDIILGPALRHEVERLFERRNEVNPNER